MKIEIDSIEELEPAAKRFLDALGDRRIVAFRGEMGAGKTTFIGAVCRALGVADIANSPSFSIANEYEARTSGELIYHFDFYRLESPAEALDIGVEDYFDSGRLCLIEWPEMIADLLPEEALNVYIEENPLTGVRTISFDENV